LGQEKQNFESHAMCYIYCWKSNQPHKHIANSATSVHGNASYNYSVTWILWMCIQWMMNT